MYPPFNTIFMKMYHCINVSFWAQVALHSNTQACASSAKAFKLNAPAFPKPAINNECITRAPVLLIASIVCIYYENWSSCLHQDLRVCILYLFIYLNSFSINTLIKVVHLCPNNQSIWKWFSAPWNLESYHYQYDKISGCQKKDAKIFHYLLH